MKKTILYSLFLILAFPLLVACNDDDDQLSDSRVTYYPVLTVQGDEFVIVPIGSSYTDEGCTATLQGEDYSSHVEASGISDIDTNQAGLYYVTYTAVNADGYSVSASRTVAVCDPSITTDLSGSYTLQEGSYRLSKGVKTAYSGYNVKVSKAAPGIFKVSDFLGGYYDQRAGYGSNYAMTGYIQLLADNTVKILSGDVPGWGDSYTDFQEGKYDPATKTISYVVTYAGMEFHVSMKI